MIDYDPQPLDALRARYPAAILWLWGEKDFLRGERPGHHRENVLDTTDGIRFIVSREHFPQYGPLEVVHFSASFQPHGDAERLAFAGHWPSSAKLFDWLVARFRGISCVEGRVEFMGLSPGKLIPNWVVWQGSPVPARKTP